MLRGFAKTFHLLAILVIALVAVPMVGSRSFAQGASEGLEPAQVEQFLAVTGFDVALDSIALSAEAAPDMLGLEADVFGSDWQELARRVFDREEMRALALQALVPTLTAQMLDHAEGFYGSELGQRLVAAENAAHQSKSDAGLDDHGEALVAEMLASGAPRLAVLQRMSRAIDAQGHGLRAMQEVQIRFLLAASAAGVIELEVDEDELRALFAEQDLALRLAMQQSALASAAATYEGFSDADLDLYADALEQPLMQTVYELLNGVQYLVMTDRFELLARKLADLNPAQDI